MLSNFKIILLISFILLTSSCKKLSELILFENAIVDISDKPIDLYGTYQLNGKWEFWHENGQKIYEGEYKNGQEIKHKRWNSKGKRLWFK